MENIPNTQQRVEIRQKRDTEDKENRIFTKASTKVLFLLLNSQNHTNK